jgi:hypothetical protein
MMPGRLGRSRGLASQAVLAGLVAAALLVAGFRQVPIGEVERSLRHATPLLVAAAALAALGFVAARAWRFRVLLFPGSGQMLPSLLVITLAAWGPGLVLPAVASDATFVWLARTRLGVGVERGAAAVIVARLLDLASLLAIGLVSATVAGVALPASLRVAGTAGALALVGLTAALLWARTRGPLLDLPRRLPRLGPRVDGLDAALALAARPGAIAGLALSTLTARLFSAVQYLALFAAVGQVLSFWQGWFALSVRTLLLGLPVQGVGGLGTTQLWWVTALVLLGQPLHRALTAGVSLHLLDLTISLCLACMGWIPLVSLRRSAYQRA